MFHGRVVGPEKGKWFVPQKGQVVCSYKRATGLSLKKGNWFVPQKGQLICHSKRETDLSLKKYTDQQLIVLHQFTMLHIVFSCMSKLVNEFSCTVMY